MKNIEAEAQKRITQKVEEVRAAFGKDIVSLLKQVNAARLAGKGKKVYAFQHEQTN